MTRPFTVDLDSADYEPARTALEWAFHNARRLGYSLPLSFEVAMQLLKGEAKPSFYISTAAGSFFSVVEDAGDSGDEDFDDFMALLTARARRVKDRKKEAMSAIAAFAAASLPKSAPPRCAQCGSFRPKGSDSLCHRCREVETV